MRVSVIVVSWACFSRRPARGRPAVRRRRVPRGPLSMDVRGSMPSFKNRGNAAAHRSKPCLCWATARSNTCRPPESNTTDQACADVKPNLPGAQGTRLTGGPPVSDPAATQGPGSSRATDGNVSGNPSRGRRPAPPRGAYPGGEPTRRWQNRRRPVNCSISSKRPRAASNSLSDPSVSPSARF